MRHCFRSHFRLSVSDFSAGFAHRSIGMLHNSRLIFFLHLTRTQQMVCLIESWYMSRVLIAVSRKKHTNAPVAVVYIFFKRLWLVFPEKKNALSKCDIMMCMYCHICQILYYLIVIMFGQRYMSQVLDVVYFMI